MKRLFVILYFLPLLVTAQSVPPHAFNYSGIARTSWQNTLINDSISVQFSIVKNNANGVTLYSENQFTRTDAFGHFSLSIGTGQLVSGSFDSISWDSDNFYLKVSIDSSGSTHFNTALNTQLISVPYALYAEHARSINGSIDSGAIHYLGEFYGGGVIFYLYTDSNGFQRGLIVAPVDQGDSIIWSNVDSLIGPIAESTWDGASNTDAIVNQTGETMSAAQLCKNYSGGGFSDWYLPSIDELNILNNNLFNINKTLTAIGGRQILIRSYYWSSTEYDRTTAMKYWMTIDAIGTYKSDGYVQTRAIRSF